MSRGTTHFEQYQWCPQNDSSGQQWSTYIINLLLLQTSNKFQIRPLESYYIQIPRHQQGNRPDTRPTLTTKNKFWTTVRSQKPVSLCSKNANLLRTVSISVPRSFGGPLLDRAARFRVSPISPSELQPRQNIYTDFAVLVEIKVGKVFGSC